MRTFADRTNEPTEADLEGGLGQAWAAMKSVLDLTADFRRNWNFSNAGGWMLKVHDGRKALLYLIPRLDSLTISMAIRESEREALLSDSGLAGAVRVQLECARHYAEGYALKLDISGVDDLQPLEPFLRELVRLRHEGTA